MGGKGKKQRGAGKGKGKKQRGAGKRKMGNKKNARKSGGKKKQNNKKRGNKMRGSPARQSTDCLADVVTAIKGYRSAGNQKRMAMRIKAWKNCSVTAAALCDDSTVNDTGADACATKFEEYITAFDDCLKTPTCDCFKALTPVESSCKFNDANTAAKALKDKCFKSDTPGSFG